MKNTDSNITIAEAAKRTGLSESTISTNPDFLARLQTIDATFAATKAMNESNADPAKMRAAMLDQLTKHTEIMKMHLDLAKKEFCIPISETVPSQEISLEMVAENNDIFDADELAKDPELAELLIAGMRADLEIARLDGISEDALEGLRASSVVRSLIYQGFAASDIQSRCAEMRAKLPSS
jgi:hypothetical protein